MERSDLIGRLGLEYVNRLPYLIRRTRMLSNSHGAVSVAP